MSVPDNVDTMGPRMGMRREPCAVCGMPVFLAEKLMISRTPYHRTCFRCARCNNQLTPGNYYETEEGQYCCETCPDEEETKTPSKSIFHQDLNETVISEHEDESQQKSNLTTGYQRSLSDEEKTERIQERIPSSLSSRYTAEEIQRDSQVAENISHSAQMRLNFMTKNLLVENRDDTENSSSNDEDYSLKIDHTEEDGAGNKGESSPPGGSFKNSRSPKGSPNVEKEGDGRVDAVETPFVVEDDHDSISNAPNVDNTRSSRSDTHERINDSYVDYNLRVNDDKINKSFDTATNEAMEESHCKTRFDDKDGLMDRQDTKDTLGLDIEIDAAKRRETIVDTSQCLSLVQRRLKIFENDENNASSSLNNKQSPVHLKESHINEEETSENKTDSSFEMKMNEETASPMKTEKIPEEKLEIPISEVKEERSLPPIVPKRTTLESRKAGKGKKKKSEVTVLNASGIDLSAEENYPEDLNPFKSDEETEDKAESKGEISRSSKVSTNPFGSSDEDEDDSPKTVAPPRPAARSTVAGNKTKDKNDEEAPTKRKLKAPQINLNPFWSDDDEDHETEDEYGGQSFNANTPIPKPRSIKQTAEPFISQRRTDLHRGDIYASNSSIGSTGSASTPGGTYRKKKPAPPPPMVNEVFPSGANSLLSPNRDTFTGSNNSLRTTPRARKAKPAPPIPMPTSTPCSENLIANLSLTESPITDSRKIIESQDYEMWDDRKIGKDEANRNKQSMTTMSSDETNPYGQYTDKSVQGKWKRKKGPAPARPIPHRRKIKVMSMKEVKLELDEIEMQQQGLERQGVRLEQLIRDKAESGDAAEDTRLEMDVEELVLELFVLVNEKNELFRRQAELMLLRRQQRLEEEHADIEYQIRCLLCQPEATKTDFDKQREETLIQRLVEIVERRNEIVECLEMDRRREIEEDRSINTRMGLYAAKTKADSAKELDEDENNRSKKSKKTKLKEKAKEKILRKVHKKDADKDVDETEVKLKRQNKKKWF